MLVSEAEEEAVNTEEMARMRTRGYVIRCDGEHAVVSAEIEDQISSKENYWAVGQLVTIKVGHNRVVGLTCGVDVPESRWAIKGRNEIHVTLELVGEIIAGEEGALDKFSSGISNYPKMGCVAHRIRSEDLGVIYRNEGESVVKIGNLTQDRDVDAKIDVDKLLSRHFAIVGTTGVGKSTSVTLIMRKIIQTRPDIRILMLDPHNEFASAFPNTSIVVDSSNLVLPFWLFKLDEFAEVVFRGQSGFDAEIEILGDMIPLAKEKYRSESENQPGRIVRKTRSNLTADMPMPYRLLDLMKLIDDRMGQLDGKAEKPILKSLLARLESISNDARFRFMFDAPSAGDIMESIISTIFRVPQKEKPICVLEMSGLPSEVVNSVVSVLSRMAFDLAMASDGGIQTLVVCEEAHRYIPADRSAGFWPTRQAIARIAKEGRKYGVYLSIVTQRPGELDPTILSQCNTLFAMRLGNQKDQEIIRGAVSNGAKSTIGFLSSIANRECIAFGEAIHTPMRMTFETIAAKDLPGAHIYEQQQAVKKGLDISLTAVMRRMRQEGGKVSAEEDLLLEEPGQKARISAPPIPQRESMDPAPQDEINSILNTAYSAQNSSLETSYKDNFVQTPSMQTPVASPPPAKSVETEKPERQPSRASSLIKNFRGK